MQKVIAITCGKTYKEGYVKAIEELGYCPILLPPIEKIDIIEKMIDLCDGIIFTGGEDVHPKYFGEDFDGTKEVYDQRDFFEITIARLSFEKKKNMLGICRGMQVINIAMGGTIYQDMNGHIQKEPKDCWSHTVNLEKDSMLYNCFKKDKIYVNSFHHQSVKKVAEGFSVTAGTDDGVIEAIEKRNDFKVIGVQWHPETMWEKYSEQLNVFREVFE